MGSKLRCRFCHDDNFIKKGFRKTKIRGKLQKYFCKTCGKTFVEDTGFIKMRNSERIISMAIDEYFEALSSRKCARNLKSHSYTKISHTSILDWIRKYVLLLNNFLDKLNPRFSSELITDETTIKTEGQQHQLGIVLDSDSRFIVASNYWDKRGCELTPKDIADFWRKAKEIHSPEKWTSDSHKAYLEAFKKVFYSRYKANRVDWNKINSSKEKRYNVKIERFNKSLKERIRSMYGFKASWSATIILFGWIIHYNFVRPHMGLDGDTPAQRAGIDLELGINKWLSLIKLAL